MPVARQSPPTLLLSLVDGLLEPPLQTGIDQTKREENLNAIISELYRRGFDVESIVRDVWVSVIATSIIGSILVALVAGEDLPVDWTYHIRSNWGPLLLGSDDVDTAIGNLRSEGLVEPTLQRLLFAEKPKVYAWLLDRNLHDLIAWNTPTKDEFDQTAPVTPEGISSDHVWLVERFTKTYLDEWSTGSLHREWEYLRARKPAPCNASQMQARRIDWKDVAQEISERSTGSRGPRGSGSLPIGKYVGVALDLLKRGDRQSAVAIFDVACRALPLSGEALNNRGFCRLPDDPKSALDDFEQAAEIGGADPFVIAANRMLALRFLDRASSALLLADDCWASEAITGGAWLWDYRAAEPTIIAVENVRTYIAELAALIAHESDDRLKAERWGARAKEYLEPPSNNDNR